MGIHRQVIGGTLVLGALFAPIHVAQAQGGQVGAIVGATFSTLRGLDGLDSRTGLLGGLSFVTSGGTLAWQPEVLAVSKGAKGTTTGAQGLKLDYLEIPVLLRLSLSRELGMRPHVYAGPYLGFQLDCSVKGSSADCNDLPGVSTHTVDVGGIVGGGLDFDLGPLVLTGGVRYGFGVSTVADFELGQVKESAKNGVWALYTGLSFRVGGR